MPSCGTKGLRILGQFKRSHLKRKDQIHLSGAASAETHPARGCLRKGFPIPGDGCVIDSLVIKISVLSRALFLSNNSSSLKNIKLKVIIIGPKENGIKCHTKFCMQQGSLSQPGLKVVTILIVRITPYVIGLEMMHRYVQCLQRVREGRGICSLVCEDKSVSQSYGTIPVWKK